MKIYKHLFFDLDRTLWDFDKNTALTLYEIIDNKGLEAIITDFDLFISSYHKINLSLWADYRNGLMSKEILRTERFYLTLLQFGIDDRGIARQIGDEYLKDSPKKTLLMPHSIDVLEFLSPKYKMHLLTNGFFSTQTTKIARSGLEKYFENLISSEKVGFHKPHQEIFLHSLELAGASAGECLMIGDDLEVDILGARNAGIDQMYYNPEQIPHNETITYEINSLMEITSLL